MKTTLALLSLALLVGCVTPEEAARNLADHEARQQSERQAYVAGLQRRCSSFGFRPGTDAFADCIRKEHNEVQRCDRLRSNLALQYNLRLLADGGARYLEGAARAARATPSPSEYGC